MLLQASAMLLPLIVYTCVPSVALEGRNLVWLNCTVFSFLQTASREVRDSDGKTRCSRKCKVY